MGRGSEGIAGTEFLFCFSIPSVVRSLSLVKFVERGGEM